LYPVDKKTLNLWNRGFTKESPSGTLTLPEFTRLYRQYFPFGDPGPFAEHVFRALDTDKNGAIDFREFIVSLNATTRAAADEKLSFCFRLYDVTGDGWITRNEMLLVVDSIYRMVGNVVAAQLPEDEQSPEARVDKLFAVFDTVSDYPIFSAISRFRAHWSLSPTEKSRPNITRRVPSRCQTGSIHSSRDKYL
jgi:Ca2+-binding EF-hand superfamily protein